MAFLVPEDYNPPLGSGQQCLPSELYDNYPYAEVLRYEKISFAGYEWWVKRTHDPVGPGPNYFSDSNENVWVDPNGHLHLRIVQRDGRWYCSEVIADISSGYGTYVFTVKGRVDLMDENVVLGLFTWEDCVPEHNYREIDIEFGRWGNPADDNAQYVVQPWYIGGNRYRFGTDCSVQDTMTNIFTWSQDKICFRSYYEYFSLLPASENMITSWSYTGNDIPPPGSENPRINFWLMNGLAPNNGQSAEIIIRDFQYIPDTGPDIDLVDYLLFASHWLESGCATCGGADLDDDGDVNLSDLKKLVENWLGNSFAVTGDITGDRVVNHEDLAEVADQWLQTPGVPSADIAPLPDGDNMVDFLDFAVLARNWLADK